MFVCGKATTAGNTSRNRRERVSYAITSRYFSLKISVGSGDVTAVALKFVEYVMCGAGFSPLTRFAFAPYLAVHRLDQALDDGPPQARRVLAAVGRALSRANLPNKRERSAADIPGPSSCTSARTQASTWRTRTWIFFPASYFSSRLV